MKKLIFIFIFFCANIAFAQNATISNETVIVNCYWQTIEVESTLPGMTGINEYLKKHPGYQPIKPIKAFKKGNKTYFVWIIRYEICK